MLTKDTPEAKIGALRDDITRMGAIVAHQMSLALEAFVRNDERLAQSVVEQDDAVDSLNLRVESAAFDTASLQGLSPGNRRAIVSALKVAINLERIGDAATHIGKRVSIQQREGAVPYPYDLSAAQGLVISSIEEAVRAWLDEDLEMAKRACELEPALDGLYVDGIHAIRVVVMSDPAKFDYSLHLLAVLKYLEKVGDYVLNIGEQTIFLVTGNRLHFSQFQQLDHLLHQVGRQETYAPFHDGISGAVVAKVGATKPLLYKDGNIRKIQEEVESTNAWNQIDDDLVPHIVSSVTYEDRQALLREFVDGTLLSQVFFDTADTQLQRKVTDRLCSTLNYLWERTYKEERPSPRYVDQIRKRLPEVYQLHPELQDLAEAQMRSHGKAVRPLDQLLEIAELNEDRLLPSFSVWLHGDLNSNNIVFNTKEDRLKFIDIHRSGYGDYLQDLSVLLVGLRRAPDLSPVVRRRLTAVEDNIVSFARDFASRHGDPHVDVRMRLGFARSFLTSARIVLNPTLAEWLFKQGRLCLQEVVTRV